jgi:hypothetical protein
MISREQIRRMLREEVESTPTKFTYTTMRPFVKGSTKKYYFNKVVPVPDSSPIPGSIKLEGPEGNFIFSKSVLKMELDKQTISIFQRDFNVSNPEHTAVNKTESTGINSKNVKLALEKAFPQYWNSENAIFSAGLRGIYTIGSKIDEPEQDWSIMNYFDTKAEIHDLLYSRYLEENPDMDIVDWMSDVFRNDDDFTDELVNRQWKSIENGILNEKKAIEALVSKKGSGNVIVYPFGSKMDRFGGIDVTIDGVNYQIKPLSSYKEIDGKYIVSTYGMKDYTNKTKLHKIVFYNSKNCLIFDNKNYTVPSKFNAIFNQTPEII